MPFEELRRRSNITERAKTIEDGADFSAQIRKGLPGYGDPMARTESTSAESWRS